MEFNELINLHDELKKIDKQINENVNSLFYEIKKALNNIEESYPEKLHINRSKDDDTIMIHFFDESILIKNEKVYGVPKENLQKNIAYPNITYKEIVNNNSIRTFYCGLINIYYLNKKEKKYINLDKIYVNVNNEIACLNDNKYLIFKKKDQIIDKLSDYILSELSKIYDLEPYFKSLE